MPYWFGGNTDTMRSCLHLEGRIHCVDLWLVFVCFYSAGDQYTAFHHSHDAQIKITLPLVGM